MAEFQSRRNNILLLNKILTFRENISPFTLVIDDLEQTSKPLLKALKSRAKVSRVESACYIYHNFNDGRRQVQILYTFLLVQNVSSGVKPSLTVWEGIEKAFKQI